MLLLLLQRCPSLGAALLPLLACDDQLRLAGVHPALRRCLAPSASASDGPHPASASLIAPKLVLGELRRQAARVVCMPPRTLAAFPSTGDTATAAPLAYWLAAGPGWRASHWGPLQPGVSYRVFYDDWLHLVPPVQVGPDAAAIESPATALPAPAQLVLSRDLLASLRGRPASVAERQAEAAQLAHAGRGFVFEADESPFGAASRPRPAAASAAGEAEEQLAQLDSLRAALRAQPIPPLSHWDASELRHFLFAWQSLSSLLPSSYLVGMGSEHLVPWPMALVAPLAPGYIGGFLTGADHF